MLPPVLALCQCSPAACQNVIEGGAAGPAEVTGLHRARQLVEITVQAGGVHRPDEKAERGIVAALRVLPN